MNVFIKSLITICLAMVSLATFAQEGGYIASIPFAVVKDEVYKVNINKIDGKNAVGTVNYGVPAGEHEVTISVVPDYNLMPRLPYLKKNQVFYGKITVNVEAGKTHQIGAKVNAEATREEQESGKVWQPVVYKVL